MFLNSRPVHTVSKLLSEVVEVEVLAVFLLAAEGCFVFSILSPRLNRYVNVTSHSKRTGQEFRTFLAVKSRRCARR